MRNSNQSQQKRTIEVKIGKNSLPFNTNTADAYSQAGTTQLLMRSMKADSSELSPSERKLAFGQD